MSNERGSDFVGRVTELDRIDRELEDLARDLAGAFDAEPRIGGYRLEVENFESIHNHSAYAQITRDKSAG